MNPNPGFVKFLKDNESKLRPRKSLSALRPKQASNFKPDCELCNLQKKTQWFEKHTVDKSNLLMKFQDKHNGKSEFTVLLCDQCDCPIVVYTGPLGHHQNLTPIQFQDVMMIASQFGNQFYGMGNWYVDTMQRTIPDHFHLHIRRVDYDSHIPLFRTFDPEPIDRIQVAGIRSLEKLKEVSA